MKILIVNCGSSSVKYQLFQLPDNFCLAKGMVSRIGMSGAVLTHKPHDRPEVTISSEILDHTIAIEHVIAILLSPNHGVIKNREEIAAVGHRVVHGGEQFTASCLVTPEIMLELRKLIELAPLHNPHNIRGINATLQNLPGVPNVAVFDTAFHHKMPEHAFIYPLPYILYRKYRIRRYGFHGMNHHFVPKRAAEMLNTTREKPSGYLALSLFFFSRRTQFYPVKRSKKVKPPGLGRGDTSYPTSLLSREPPRSEPPI